MTEIDIEFLKTLPTFQPKNTFYTFILYVSTERRGSIDQGSRS